MSTEPESAWERPQVAGDPDLPAEGPRRPPAAHVVGSRFRGTAGREAATFEATLTLRREGSGGAAVVELFPAGVAVLGCEGPESVFLCNDYGATHAVITAGGNQTITVRLVVGYRTDRMGHCLDLPLPAAPGHELLFHVPQPGRSIQVRPAVEALCRDEGGGSELTATIGPVASARIEWSDGPQAGPLVRAEVGSVAAVGDERLTITTHIRYEVRRASVERLELRLPDGAAFHSAEGDGLRGWEVAGNRVVALEFHRPVLGEVTLSLNWEAEIDPAGPIELPRLELLGVERESGYLTLESRTNLELALQSVEGAEAIDVRDLPRALWELCHGPPLLAYHYAAPGYALRLSVTRHREIEVLVAAVERAFCRSVLVRDGQMETQLRLELRNNQQQFLRLALPHDAALRGAFVSGRPVKPALDHQQRRTLIALEKSANGGEETFPVELVYVSRMAPLGKQGEVQLFLPAVDMPINHLLVRLFLPDCCKYTRFEGGLSPVEQFSEPWPEPSSAEPRRSDAAPIGEEHRFERLLLLQGSCDLRFRYKRRWRR